MPVCPSVFPSIHQSVCHSLMCWPFLAAQLFYGMLSLLVTIRKNCTRILVISKHISLFMVKFCHDENVCKSYKDMIIVFRLCFDILGIQFELSYIKTIMAFSVLYFILHKELLRLLHRDKISVFITLHFCSCNDYYHDSNK